MNTNKKTWKKSAFSQITSAEAVQVKSPRKQPRLSNGNFKDYAEKPVESSTTTTTSSACGEIPTNWMDEFAPQQTDDLAVHTKKVTELHNWLQHCEASRHKQPAQLCLLTGPAGCGKTATVRVLAEQYHYQVQEWINPVDREAVTTLGDQMPGSGYVASQVDAFKSFLLRASRYKSLFDRYDKRMLLVEDFPNALLSDAAAFETILENYLQYGKAPLVFIVADSKSRALNISYKLFSDDVKHKLRICHICFNAIAATFMQKAMQRFCALMRQQNIAAFYKVPAQHMLDSIVVSAQGDIRNALINLHFAALKGAPGVTVVPVAAQESQSKSKGNKKRQHTLKFVGRDESLTMMHALGRALNPKYSSGSNSSDRRLLHSPEELAEAFRTEPKKFIDFLHANYLPHYSDIEHVLLAADALSQTDIILTEYREHTLALTGLNVGVRGVMVANQAPVSGWMPVRGPKRLTALATNQRILDGGHYVSANMYATDYATFLKRIVPKDGAPSETETVE